MIFCIVVFDFTCNTQNSLLLNQHNGDDAPQENLEAFQHVGGTRYLTSLKTNPRQIFYPIILIRIIVYTPE